LDIIEMMKNPEILKTLSTGEKLLGSLVVMVLGLLTCFIVLLIIMLAIRVMGSAVGRTKKPKEAAAVAPSPAPAPAANPVVAAPQADEEELIAVITAAIAAMTGGSSVIIKNIREKKSAPALSNWVVTGRGENFSSRRVTR
jgi:sodium pump decarboxylase gamma subunit